MVFGGNQFKIYLKRRIAQNSRKLGLRIDFYGHEIQKQDLQRTDILRHGTGFRHEEDVFFFQRFCGGKLVWDFDRHGGLS